MILAQSDDDRKPETSASPTALEMALAYASRGWQVFPAYGVRPDGTCTCGPGCDSAGKHPLTGRGYKNATTSPVLLRHWFTKWPNANIGLVTGDGFFVVDIDPRNGGDHTWHELVQQHGPIPDTVTSLTGGGGIHIFS